MNTEELKTAAESYGMQFVESISPEWTDSALLENLPVTWARVQRVLPVRRNGEALLLTASADCLAALQQAELASGVRLNPALADADLLLAAIDRAYYDGGRETRDVRKESQGKGVQTQSVRGPASAADQGISAITDDLLAGNESAPVTQLLNSILLDAVRSRASDIHCEPHPGGMRIRFRIDGSLYEQPAPPAHNAEALISRAKVMARMDIAERRLPQDGMAQVRIGGRVIDIRVSTVPVADGERLVMRILDRDNAWVPLSELGMGKSVFDVFSGIISLPNGLVVVSGPTGSGKTTTLYSALGSIDSKHRNILTVEDPVEYRLPAIGQIQVMPKIGLTFAAGLRHILRQDPDVVLVGETRDSETAEIAVRAALTGHLVFTTLHTNDAPGAVARLVDMGIEPYLLSSCLRGVLAQRLVRKLCPHCREKMNPFMLGKLNSAAAALAAEAGNEPWTSTGCFECLDGYHGRTGIYEMMPCGESVAESIRLGGRDAATLRAVASKLSGYRSMRSDAVSKIAGGITDIKEALTALSV